MLSGEGPSGVTSSPGATETHTLRSSEEAMEVDESGVGGPTDSMNLLSPPASNERPEGYAVVCFLNGSTWFWMKPYLPEWSADVNGLWRLAADRRTAILR